MRLLIRNIYPTQNVQHVINYTNPMLTRRWLLLLQAHQSAGILIRPNQNRCEGYLGFSFDSNPLGLRGPCAQQADHVILGTSFAMGFAVPNNLNWYDQCPFDPLNTLNLGLPVGVDQMQWLLNTFYRGSYEHAWVLYHPNFWTLGRQYWALNADTNAFSCFRWQTDYSVTKRMTFQKRSLMYSAIQKGLYSILKNRTNQTVLLNNQYSFMDFDRHTEFTQAFKQRWRDLLERFRKVTVIKVSPKEEIAFQDHTAHTPLLSRTIQCYDHGWSLFAREIAPSRSTILSWSYPQATLAMYHPADTHWNILGNRTFASYITPYIEQES